MTPIEATNLEGAKVPFEMCPRCGAYPFEPFLRGQVQRDVFSPWRALLRLFGKTRPHCAVICRGCKEIVGWEAP